MKKHLVYIIMCAVAASVVMPVRAIDRQTLIQYASSLKGKKKAELKKAIYNISQPKKVLAYGSGSGKTWEGFSKTDRIQGTNECINRYSEHKFYFSSANSTEVISGMNIEHSFPKSWWGGTTNNAYKDLFNLYPSETDANSKKSNYPMGKVTNPNILNDYEKVGSGPAGSLGNIKLCEPNDVWKGDFCRSYFYMATTYQNLTWSGTQGLQQCENNDWPTLREWAYTLYLEWTRADKVLDVEVVRNNEIYKIQGNRNLYIDFPFLAEYVWGDSINVEFDPYTSLTTASDDKRYDNYSPSDPGDDDDDDPDNPDPGKDPIDPDDPNDVEGDYYFAETFDNCGAQGGNDGNWSGSMTTGSVTADNKGWTITTGYGADACVRMGTGSKQGSATTPSISGLKGKTFILSFRAGAWDGDATTLYLKGNNCTLSVSSVELERAVWNTYEVEVTDVTGEVSITFTGSSSKGRFFLDDILIPMETIFDPRIDYLCITW